MPTGDPKCPPHLVSAKHIYRKIVEATDGSTGASDLEDDLEDDDDERVEDDDEEEYDGDDFPATMEVEDGNNEGEGPGEHPVVLGHATVADRSLGNDEEGKYEGGSNSNTLGVALTGFQNLARGAKKWLCSTHLGGRAAKKAARDSRSHCRSLQSHLHPRREEVTMVVMSLMAILLGM